MVQLGILLLLLGLGAIFWTIAILIPAVNEVKLVPLTVLTIIFGVICVLAAPKRRNYEDSGYSSSPTPEYALGTPSPAPSSEYSLGTPSPEPTVNMADLTRRHFDPGVLHIPTPEPTVDISAFDNLHAPSNANPFHTPTLAERIAALTRGSATPDYMFATPPPAPGGESVTSSSGVTYMVPQAYLAELHDRSSALDAEHASLEAEASQLHTLDAGITTERATLNRYNQTAVDQFNEQVERANALRAKYSSDLDNYNAGVRAYNARLADVGTKNN